MADSTHPHGGRLHGAAPFDPLAVRAVAGPTGSSPPTASSVRARAAGLVPDILVGDLDSVSADGLAWATANAGRASPRRQGGDRHRAGAGLRRVDAPAAGAPRRRERRPPRPRHRRPRRPRRRRTHSTYRRSRAGGAPTTCSSPAPDAACAWTGRWARRSPARPARLLSRRDRRRLALAAR